MTLTGVELTDEVVTCDDAIAREVAGEMVLLNLASGTYFGLNETGGKIWNWLDERACSLAAISARLEEEYEVPTDQAQHDVLALADELIGHGLLRKA